MRSVVFGAPTCGTTRSVLFDDPKTQRSKRSVPLGAKSIEILSARKPAGVDPEALVFTTRTGTPFERHNLVNKQLKPTCKRLRLVGVSWLSFAKIQELRRRRCAMVNRKL